MYQRLIQKNVYEVITVNQNRQSQYQIISWLINFVANYFAAKQPIFLHCYSKSKKKKKKKDTQLPYKPGTGRVFITNI